ncbi:MAG: excisionase family DNA-binding protein [Dethiobacter sp.]
MAERTRLLPKEAAAFVGCGYDKLLQLVRQGQIPHYRIGKRVFFTKERLSLWIEDMEQESSKSKKRS